MYSILLPPPTEAIFLCTRAAVLVGAFAGLFADMKTLGDPDAPRSEKIAKALGKLTEILKQVDPVASNQLMTDAVYAAHLTFGNKPISEKIDFDRHFDPKEMRKDVYPVMLWCLWECVGDFFPELGAFTQGIKVMAAEGLKSQKDGEQTTG
jgi:hypothetical protein